MKLIKKLLEVSQKEALQKLVHGATDVGKARTVNEDYYIISREKNLYIVADGMGGHNAGDIASENATKMADAYLTLNRIEEIRDNNRNSR